jgi:hypothetical protein
VELRNSHERLNSHELRNSHARINSNQADTTIAGNRGQRHYSIGQNGDNWKARRVIEVVAREETTD